MKIHNPRKKIPTPEKVFSTLFKFGGPLVFLIYVLYNEHRWLQASFQFASHQSQIEVVTEKLKFGEKENESMLKKYIGKTCKFASDYIGLTPWLQFKC